MEISVIIATCNRCERLKGALESLLAQECDGTFTFDVIVVDNNSTDQTKNVVEGLFAAFPGRLTYLFEPERGKMHAVNTGIQVARGDILAFTDDDVTADPKWLVNMARCFAAHSCDGVGGRILPVYPPGTPAWIKENAEILAGPIVLYDYGEDVRKYQKPLLEFLGANFAFKKEVFKDCGLFSTHLGPGQVTMGDDTEFVNRVLRQGKTLYYCGQALVRHPVDMRRTNFSYIARWNIALGRYRVIVDGKREVDLNLTYYFGIPRYLIREIMARSWRAVRHFFNRREFVRDLVLLSRDVGKALETQKIYRDVKAAGTRANPNGPIQDSIRKAS